MMTPIPGPPPERPPRGEQELPGQVPVRPAAVAHPPYAPVRDDRKLGVTEDLDREPDGVPHKVVGLTAFFAVVLAMLVAFMFLAGGTVTRVAAALLVVLAVPAIVGTLGRKADRERDALHPSR